MPSVLDWKIRTAKIWPSDYRITYRGTGGPGCVIRTAKPVEPYRANLTVEAAGKIAHALSAEVLRYAEVLADKGNVKATSFKVADSPWLWPSRAKSGYIDFVLDVYIRLATDVDEDRMIAALKDEGAEFF
jgi:hypothetical protein